MQKIKNMFRVWAILGLVFSAGCVLMASRLSYESANELLLFSLAAGSVFWPFIVAPGFIITLIVLLHSPNAQVALETSDLIFKPDNDMGPRASLTGMPMQNGLDPSGTPFGMDQHN